MSPDELLGIASPPVEQHAFLLDDGVQQVSKIVSRLAALSCDEAVVLDCCRHRDVLGHAEDTRLHVAAGETQYFRAGCDHFPAGARTLVIELTELTGATHL